MTSGAWNPWARLREEPELRLARRRLPDGIRGLHVTSAGWHLILIDDRLDLVERNCTLAHELVHHERGGACPMADDVPAALSMSVLREEQRVNDIVARRLVPRAELLSFCVAQADLGGGLEAWHVAEEFGVTEEVARRALELLDQDTPRRRPT